MTESPHSAEDLQQLYRTRFEGKAEYRQALWKVLSKFFSRWIPSDSAVLDLGCGYCEFINSVLCSRKLAMDLNPDVSTLAAPGVELLAQDCSEAWPTDVTSLDVVFTSNFFEHLPSKTALEQTLTHAHKALKSGGLLIAMGPNIKYLPGSYWDFFDHYLPLTELSLSEILEKCGFTIEVRWDRFLPYTMCQGRTPPIWLVKSYLKMPAFWSWFGKQFLIVARKS